MRQMWKLSWKTMAGGMLAGLCLAGLPAGLDAREAQNPSRSLGDGVFSTAQVARGETVYAAECARCHAPTLNGGESSPPLVGELFIQLYQGLTVKDLFERIRASMPQESPGRLSRQQYVDVVAFILSSNGYPAGEKELPHEAAALADVRIDPVKSH